MTRNESIFKQFLTFNRYLIPYWSLEALVLLIVFLTSFLGLLGPYLTRITIDQAFGKHDLYLFNMLILAGFILTVFQGSLSVIQQYLSAYIGRRLTFDLRSDYTHHLFRLSFSDFHRRPTGEQIYRLGPDIDTVSTLATDSIPQIIISSTRLVFLLGICFYLNWKLTLITIVLSPLFYLHARFFGLRQKSITRKIKQKSQDTTALIQDTLINIKLIKAFNRGMGAVRDYLHQRIAIIRLSLKLVRLNIFGNLSAGILNSLVLIGFSYYIGYQVIEGRLTLGTLVALILYLTQLFAALKSLGRLGRAVMVKFVSWERVQQTLHLPREEEKSGAVSLPAVTGEIGYQSVSFGYRPGVPVIDNISFRINPGEYVGIVGPSGCGKTTLLMLLLRLLRPWRGAITVDGHDLKDIRWRSLQPFMGVALQEAYVLNRSLAENLRFGMPQASEEDMWRALDIADLEETVREMEDGLETLVGEAGSSLSEGQRQRLNIARAVMRQPRILILDEATSAIGFDSEARIFSRFREKLPRTTFLCVSHRLGSHRGADRILVLRAGVLIEEGSHQKLMEDRGFYRFLFENQFQNPETVHKFQNPNDEIRRNVQ